MNRRNLIKSLALGGGVFATGSLPDFSIRSSKSSSLRKEISAKELRADVVIVGGGTGGYAAALSALRNGLNVIMTEETDWIGGQFTQQGLSCPDEHQWIEEFGATRSYQDFRTSVRKYYKANYPLSKAAEDSPYLDPGNGAVSRLCHEPRIALEVLYENIRPYLSAKKLVLLLNTKAKRAEVGNDKVKAVIVADADGNEMSLHAPYFIDATELGDLLPMTGTEFVIGAESRQKTGELHAPEKADPAAQQAFTHCLAMDYVEGASNLIEKPEGYGFWKNYIPSLDPPWPGKLFSLQYSSPSTLRPKRLGFNPNGVPTGKYLNLWNYRRIIDPENFRKGLYQGGITIVNWPQNDFLLGNLVGVSEEEYRKTVAKGEQLSLSLFYWLQTEALRPDGGQGWAGLRLRGDIMGTETGLAKYPYIREARRIKAVFTVLEEHVGKQNRAMVAGEEAGKYAAPFYDSVGVGSYHIDLHPTSSGVNYIDFGSLPFQIPLGALLPKRMKNLIPASKNIGTTHITNGCYRLHPVEWNIGESAGLLIAYALNKKLSPHSIREKKEILTAFQQWIRLQGVETHWPATAIK